MRYKFELSIMIAVVFGLSLAGVASADSVLKMLYVDGVKVGSATTTQAISFPYQRLTIGSEGNAWYRYQGLNGEIDEFAVYGYVLTDANVAAHYAAAPSGYQAAVSADNPLLYLKFDNDPCSGNGYKATNSGTAAEMNVTYIGGVTFDNSAYIGSKAAVFHGTGSTGDCIDVCDWSKQLSVTDVSVEFWVKTTQSSDYPRFFQHNGSNAEQHSYGAMYSASTNAIGLIGGGSTGYVTKAINDGTWHHVVVTYNSIIPGPYAAEVLADDPCVYLKFDHPVPVDSSVNNYYAGIVPNAYVVSVAGAIGGYALEVNNAFDSGMNGCAYVWNNMGNVCYQLPGGSPYRSNAGSSNLYQPYYSLTYDSSGNPVVGPMTFEFWYKNAPGLTPDNYAMLFQQIDGMGWDSTNKTAYGQEPNAPGMGLYTDGNSPSGFKLRVLGGSQWWYPDANAPLDGQWHYVVVTYDPNANNLGHDMDIELYLDGTRYATTILDPNHLNARLQQNIFYTLIIGSEQNYWYRSNSYGGYIDEFAVYKGVLSANRVATHYAAWQPKNCAEAQLRRLALPGDLNGDCQVDLDDYAMFASQWHLCNDPNNPNCH